MLKNNKNLKLNYYLKKLDFENKPSFLDKYLKVPSLLRLKNVGYFCGMDFASKEVYNFAENISRYDHSLTVALLTYKFTKDIKATLAGLFHDIATPCFSHVIDYMNGDYEKQESTEEYTENILKNDEYLLNCLKEDNLVIDDIVDFKKYSIVDNERPKLCADRLDGIILTGIGWIKNIKTNDIKEIIDSIEVYQNELNELELGLNNKNIALKVLEISKSIDIYCHTNEDNYMMEHLAKITKLAIDKKYISYSDLYYLNEKELFTIFKNSNDDLLLLYLDEFENIKAKDIPKIDLPNVKARKLNLLVNGERLKVIK